MVATRRQADNNTMLDHATMMITVADSAICAKINRMKQICKMKGNQTCADCPSKRPLGVSFLSRDKNKKMAAVLCCSQCIRHHKLGLGNQTRKIQYSRMIQEWTTENLDTLEYSGNKMVNELYEAKLSTTKDFDKNHVSHMAEKEWKRRDKFIKDKYQKGRYYKGPQEETKWSSEENMKRSSSLPLVLLADDESSSSSSSSHVSTMAPYHEQRQHQHRRESKAEDRREESRSRVRSILQRQRSRSEGYKARKREGADPRSHHKRSQIPSTISLQVDTPKKTAEKTSHSSRSHRSSLARSNNNHNHNHSRRQEALEGRASRRKQGALTRRRSRSEGRSEREKVSHELKSRSDSSLLGSSRRIRLSATMLINPDHSTGVPENFNKVNFDGPERYREALKQMVQPANTEAPVVRGSRRKES
ncbi:expressed unknown protein [Seminavis robusta]|uniref:Arf-GAP domain-containing protein n=1 Tax=Seminavis robusta TaxID=568900 RepID=A0A9N8DPN5_9STRA|nr:expressed unknown protein [Seminavis robusta]|eukprot:Sro267_g103450.1 n/a (418) ;mRNA; f:52895-54251